jgi:hypothetical protein
VVAVPGRTRPPAGADRWLTREGAAQRRARDAQRSVDDERSAREAAQRRADAAERSADDERAAREAAQRRADAAERRIQELEALIARGR